jgi:hypothetical protein
MLAMLVTVLVCLAVVGIVFDIVDSIVVESYTISTRDFPNIAATQASNDGPDTAPAHISRQGAHQRFGTTIEVTR